MNIFSGAKEFLSIDAIEFCDAVDVVLPRANSPLECNTRVVVVAVKDESVVGVPTMGSVPNFS